MPTITVKEIEAFAFCRNHKCVGYLQEKVPAIREDSEVTYQEKGGDVPGVETSHSYLRFPDGVDSSCSHCGAERMLSEQERPVYPNSASAAQDVSAPAVDGTVAKMLADQSREMAELRAQLEAAQGGKRFGRSAD